MIYFAFGLVLLIVVLWLGRRFVAADAGILARQMRKTGGVVALAAASFLFVTGRVSLAIPLFMLAMSLLGRNAGFPWDLSGNTQKSSGQTSKVRTGTVEMELDHDTGQMHGQVLKGRYAGRALNSLTLDEVVTLWGDCRTTDTQAAQLLEALLDQAEPRWREQYAQDTTGGGGGAKIGLEEAYNVLGLKPGATRGDIQRAHKELMKRFHPDQGGSNYLAAKINEAKELLLSVTKD